MTRLAEAGATVTAAAEAAAGGRHFDPKLLYVPVEFLSWHLVGELSMVMSGSRWRLESVLFLYILILYS